MLGCGPSSPTAAPEQRRPDVLLITLDTTRADRLGAYGYDAAHTEVIDALAARGRRYENAYSPLPLTIPAHGSLMTGRYPAEHGVRANGDGWFGSEERMLAEVFREAGYATAASVGAFVTTREWGFGQGFQHYFEELPHGADFWHAERKGALVVDDLVAWKAKRADERPVFAWVHLYDPHFPHTAGEPWISQTEGRSYDAELAYTDDQIGRMLAAFDLDQTLVVVVGDHGEALGEHGELSHGLFVYDSTMRVPFIAAGPGVDAEVVEQPVSLVDVAPTILSLVGLPALKEASGRVVPGGDAPVHLESWQLAQRFGVAPHLGVVHDGHVLIDLPQPELYALGDHEQVENLAAAHPERVEALRALRQASGFEPPSADPAHPASPAQTRQLEALGYVEGGFLGDPDAPLPDPKDRTEMLALVQLHELWVLDGKQAEAAAAVRKLAAEHPDVVEFQMKLARVLVASGRLDEAAKQMAALLERDRDNALAIHFLGSLRAAQGRFDEAAVHFRDAADRMPYADRLRVMAVAALFESKGGAPAGFELARTTLAEHPEDLAVAGLLGVQLVQNGQIDQGLPLLQRGLTAEQPERDVAYLLAAAATGSGDQARAIELLDRELSVHAGHARALTARLRVDAEKGDWQAVVDRSVAWRTGPGKPHFERAPVDPAMADVFHLEAQARFNLKRYADARIALDAGFAIDPDRAQLLLLDANLLHQEGKPEEAKARFAQAQAARDRQGAPPD